MEMFINLGLNLVPVDWCSYIWTLAPCNESSSMSKASSHSMPCNNWYPLDAISKVLILNNDQHQHKEKQYNQTTGLIQRLIHTPFVDWYYCGREVLFEKTISCQTEKRNTM